MMMTMMKVFMADDHEEDNHDDYDNNDGNYGCDTGTQAQGLLMP